ncbi:LacI family DNA-binding transcriptional regulator [Metabacillus idriensis]|uniref:LacI family DNA-binding transcriptional regulator n=1 Tax=Metabacillus idriensis TaxID=324768 RepID=UPI0028146521|nr:LacI family DNA-binding transcriptional regulator [Metabacillus idriensis]MDR0138642.1 LacI family DNA-binding transcriptional regulator [Metabacillus idriensis]
MTTIKDVAKLASVAISTASSALNGKDNVKPETRYRVLEAAKQLNYKKNGYAADLKKSKSNTIALILDDLTGPFFSEIIKGVQDVTFEKEYDLITCSSIRGENSMPTRFLEEKRTDGVIVLAHKINDETIIRSEREGFPIVLLDRELESEHSIRILVDNEDGGYRAAEYLIELGHRSIGFISGNSSSHDNQLRYRGFKKALDKHSISLPGKWNLSGSFTEEGGYHATQMLIMQGNLPTAVFYANDEMALGGMKAFQEKGIKVPDDISIIGFDNIMLSGYTNPPLTTIHQPKYEMGSLAAHLVFQILNGESIEKQHYSLQTKLMIRESCRSL